MKSSVDLRLADFTKLSGDVQERIWKVVAPLVSQRAKQLAPKKSGLMAKRIGWKVYRAGTRALVFGAAPHTHLIHEGVKPHEIRVKTQNRRRKKAKGATEYTTRFTRVKTANVKGAMLIPIGGGIYRTRAWHPGFKGTPFLTDAAADIGRALDSKIGGII